MGRHEDGRLVVVVVTADGSLWSRSQPMPGHGPWSPWGVLVRNREVGGHNTERTKPVAVFGDEASLVILFPTRRGVGYLRHPTMPGEQVAVSGIVPHSPPSTECDCVAGVLRGDGRIALFCAGGSTPGLFVCVEDAPGSLEWGSWSGFALGSSPRRPAAWTTIDGRALCFVEDLRDDLAVLWRVEQDVASDEWLMHDHGAHPAGEAAEVLARVSAVQLIMDGAGRLRLFAADPSSNALYDLRQDQPNGTVWTPHVLPI